MYLLLAFCSFKNWLYKSFLKQDTDSFFLNIEIKWTHGHTFSQKCSLKSSTAIPLELYFALLEGKLCCIYRKTYELNLLLSWMWTAQYQRPTIKIQGRKILYHSRQNMNRIGREKINYWSETDQKLIIIAQVWGNLQKH
jgi:hypothetical protein